MLKDEHYYVFESKIKERCKTCYKLLLITNKNHICNPSLVRYANKEKRNHIIPAKVKEENKINYDDVVYWDLETFPTPENNVHTVYASAFMNGANYINYYGKESLKNTMEQFTNYSNKIITAYNGSGFDFYFLIDQLTALNIEVSNLILSNGKLMSFTYGDNNKVFDLCLFLTSSLDKACKDFNTLNRKTSFDHNKIKSWVDVETHRGEVEPYHKNDVMALKELFEIFNDMMYNLFQANITTYLSAGHMAYNLWTSETNDLYIELPDQEKYNFVKKATFGGRCYPQQKEFKSSTFENIRNVENGKDLYKTLIQSNDFIFNADASSLYPASMRGFELCDVAYPTGESRWSDKPFVEWNKGKVGFYEVNFTCPRNITVPILPRKKLIGGKPLGIEWSLEQGTGIFTSIDLQNAISMGYNIEFINKCLVWDKSESIFKGYVDKFYKIKEDAEKEGNEVKRNVAKLFLNSLYGKTLQKANSQTTKIINSVWEFNEFLTEYNPENYTVLNDNKLLFVGSAKDFSTKITKPVQLGAFVTAYSRRIMLTYMKAIDPTLKSIVFTYTDTDSLHIKGEHYFKLKSLGYIKDKQNASLGFLCSDIKNEGVIFYEKNIAPKNYYYCYVDNNGDIYENNKGVMKCKGIYKKALKHSLFIDEKEQELLFDGLKRKHINLTKADKEKGINHFSIISNMNKRTYNKTKWEGMNFDNNTWYPKNFYSNII
jgi:hypothetical protein